MSPRSTEQIEQIRNEKMMLITTVALELFANNGYHSTSISQIAKAAGISKGLIYNYYRSKEDLLKAILYNGMNEMGNIFDPNNDGVLEEYELIFFIKEAFRLLRENRKFWKLYFSLFSLSLKSI